MKTCEECGLTDIPDGYIHACPSKADSFLEDRPRYTARFYKNTLRVYPDGRYGSYAVLKNGVELFGIDEYCKAVPKILEKLNSGEWTEDFIKPVTAQ